MYICVLVQIDVMPLNLYFSLPDVLQDLVDSYNAEHREKMDTVLKRIHVQMHFVRILDGKFACGNPYCRVHYDERQYRLFH